ncbi:hypothetical protein ACQBJO_15550 [Janibacter sp. G349]|uniref:hypothetical protein n=1 Tax=Janibacter sp. G349 TaxID=3405424 RepID=UPI003D27C164
MREARDTADADRVAVAAEGERTTALARASAEATQAMGVAEAEARQAMGAADAEAERARLAAHAGVAPEVLMAMAMAELARNLPQIDQLVLTPDVVSSVLARLAGQTGEG